MASVLYMRIRAMVMRFEIENDGNNKVGPSKQQHKRIKHHFSLMTLIRHVEDTAVRSIA